MKKSMSIISALAITTTMLSSFSAFAIDQETVEKTQSIVVSKTVASSYTVTIPDGVVNNQIAISAENVCIEMGQELTVAVESANDFKLKAGEAELTYKLKNGDAVIANNATVLTVENGNGNAALTVDIPDATYAGTYTDTLTFTVAVD